MEKPNFRIMKDKLQALLPRGLESIRLLLEDRFYVREKRGRGVVGAAMTGSLVSAGKDAVARIDRSSRQAVILQNSLLMDLLAQNRDTEYGKKYGFASIHTVEQFKERVPLTVYDDYAPYVQRMMDGERNVLCAGEPRYFAMTSGSIGVPKYIPVSERELEKYVRYTVAMAFGVADEYYRNTTGRGAPLGPGLSAVEMKVARTKAGAERGNISASLMGAVKDYVPYLLSSPWEVVSPREDMDMKYLKARLALASRDLVFMDSVFMTTLVDLMDYIRDHYEMLCRDIYHGRISRKVRIPEEVRQQLASRITPDPARARELLHEFREGFDTPIIPRIWPRMSWIGGIGTGGFWPYARRMRRYSGKNIPFNNLCYAASESFVAAARHMGDESYVLIPDGGYYEFVPAGSDAGAGTLSIDELEDGGDYEIIVTNLSGFYRYMLRDVVRVTGFYNETPMLRFLYRKDQLLSIAGEKTNGEAMQWAMDRFAKETGVSYIDYSVYADRESVPGRYVIFVEPEHMVPKEETGRCRDILEARLMQANPAYADLAAAGDIGRLELVFLQQQTYQLYRDLMIMKGMSANQIKPVRVIDTPIKEKFFFGLREMYP